MSFLKKLINSFLGYFSLRVSRVYKMSGYIFDDPIKFLIKKKTPIIFDVGANKGQIIDRFKKLYPKCIIHSFEPQKNFLNY